jgi:FkbM family methyltransferase
LGAIQKAFHTLRWLWEHPIGARDRKGALVRWARWQLGSRILGASVVVPFVDDTVLLVDPGMTGATGNVYVGLHEFADMAFALHFLRETDRFVDAGANVGAYTILASGVRHAETLAIEPIASAFKRLQANVRLNDIGDRVRLHNVGLAANSGRLRFTSSLDTVNHVVIGDGLGESDGVDVPVTTLDELVKDRAPSLIKVDVEGFETAVFDGGGHTLADPELCAIIVELNGLGMNYGFDESELQRRFESFGFVAYTYEPFARRLERMQRRPSAGNVLYVRGVEAVQDRLSRARAVRVHRTTV